MKPQENRSGDKPIHKSLPSFKKKDVIPVSTVIMAVVFIGWCFEVGWLPLVTAGTLEKHILAPHKDAVTKVDMVDMQKKYEKQMEKIQIQIEKNEEQNIKTRGQVTIIEKDVAVIKNDVSHIKQGINRLLSRSP